MKFLFGLLPEDVLVSTRNSTPPCAGMFEQA